MEAVWRSISRVGYFRSWQHLDCRWNSHEINTVVNIERKWFYQMVFGSLRRISFAVFVITVSGEFTAPFPFQNCFRAKFEISTWLEFNRSIECLQWTTIDSGHRNRILLRDMSRVCSLVCWTRYYLCLIFGLLCSILFLWVVNALFIWRTPCRRACFDCND